MASMDIQEEQPQENEENNPLTPASDELPEQNEELLPPDSSEDFSPSDSQKDKKERKYTPEFEAFIKEIDAIEDSEKRLQRAIDFMESTLSQNGTPNFKNFWDARALCLVLFKENLSNPIKAALWARYADLSKQARRLKEILDEQSAFAVEQIEIAITALENDIQNIEEALDKFPSVDFNIESKGLSERMEIYQQTQKELNLLNAQASRINALRKELIKTEMRVRQKNKFFQRLSLVGDKVFPRRKELIKDISQNFIEDVDSFISQNFSNEDIEDSFFFLREEIKALQGLAKHLTLNTHAFTHTRMRLSECWDKIKVFEKERKKHRAQQKVIHKQNAEQVQEKIKEFVAAYAEGQVSNQDAFKTIEEITILMRGLDLGRDEVRALKEELAQAKKPLLDKAKAEEQEKQALEKEKELQKRLKIEEIKQSIDNLMQNLEQYNAEELAIQRDAIIEKINKSSLSKPEKLELEKNMKRLRSSINDAISEQKEKALLSLSEDDRLAIQQLKEVLSQRKERRQQIRNQLETIRKSSGVSGFDFEQAMSLNLQINEEKERLEKINLSIKEIEDKIVELENRQT